MKIIFRKLSDYLTDFLKYFSFIFTIKTIKEYYFSKNHQIIIDQSYIYQISFGAIALWLIMRYYHKIMREK